MKTASAPLIALLATTRQFYMTETYTFTLADGSVLTWTLGEGPDGYAVRPSEPQAPIL